jgi:hypothetical protein
MTASTCWAGTEFDTKISVYKGGACSELDCVATNDDASSGHTTCTINSLASSTQWESELYGTYYIAVHGWQLKTGNFELSVEALNDQCAFASPLGVGQDAVGSTQNAAEPVLGPTSGFCRGRDVVGMKGGLWYSVIGTGERLELSTCHVETEINAQIYIFESSCGASLGMCTESHRSLASCSSIQWDTKLHMEYLVLVQGYVPEQGTFGLSLRRVD